MISAQTLHVGVFLANFTLETNKEMESKLLELRAQQVMKNAPTNDHNAEFGEVLKEIEKNENLRTSDSDFVFAKESKFQNYMKFLHYCWENRFSPDFATKEEDRWSDVLIWVRKQWGLECTKEEMAFLKKF